MEVLFHQNMRNFGGGKQQRNAAYFDAFQDIATNLGVAGDVAVAGFTEVTNNMAAATEFGPNSTSTNGGLCAALGVTHLANIACGRTALAKGPEYIAIGFNGALNVVSVGRIFLNASGGGMGLIHDVSPMVPPTEDWCNTVPKKATIDYRGLVYVVVTIAGVDIAVGFLHNLYTFEAQRSLVMGQLPKMMKKMGDQLAGAGIAAKYIGGDFNVSANLYPSLGTTRQGIIYGYSIGLAAIPPTLPNPPHAPTPPPPPPPPFRANGTTWAGNLYDYWFSTIAPGAGLPDPTVRGITLDTAAGAANLMSDHCAITLQIT